MGSIVVNGDKLEIKELKGFTWIKKSGPDNLPVWLQNSDILGNIEKKQDWYISDCGEFTLYAFLSEIGIEPHPLIRYAGAAIWYRSNIGGVYLVGKEKNTDAIFAPVEY
jgi:hypothetical protein